MASIRILLVALSICSVVFASSRKHTIDISGTFADGVSFSGNCIIDFTTSNWNFSDVHLTSNTTSGSVITYTTMELVSEKVILAHDASGKNTFHFVFQTAYYGTTQSLQSGHVNADTTISGSYEGKQLQNRLVTSGSFTIAPYGTKIQLEGVYTDGLRFAGVAYFDEDTFVFNNVLISSNSSGGISTYYTEGFYFDETQFAFAVNGYGSYPALFVELTEDDFGYSSFIIGSECFTENNCTLFNLGTWNVPDLPLPTGNCTSNPVTTVCNHFTIPAQTTSISPFFKIPVTNVTVFDIIVNNENPEAFFTEFPWFNFNRNALVFDLNATATGSVEILVNVTSNEYPNGEIVGIIFDFCQLTVKNSDGRYDEYVCYNQYCKRDYHVNMQSMWANNEPVQTEQAIEARNCRRSSGYKKITIPAYNPEPALSEPKRLRPGMFSHGVQLGCDCKTVKPQNTVIDNFHSGMTRFNTHPRYLTPYDRFLGHKHYNPIN